MSARISQFQPFKETELRIKVAIELLHPDETFDLVVLDSGLSGQAEAGPELERALLQRAKQLLAVALHSL